MRWGALASLVLVASCGRLGFEDAALTVDAREPQPCSSLTLTAPSRSNVSTHSAFVAAGGNPPFTYAVTGGGTIDGTGRFMASTEPGTSMVTVTDVLGCTSQASIIVGGTSLYYFEGQNGVNALAGVFTSTNGTSWTAAASLPTARARGAVLVFEDRLWFIGGGNDLTYLSDVLATSDGQSWTHVGSLPTTLIDTTGVVFDEQIWLAGGHGNPGSVWRSPDGINWTRMADLPFPSHGGVLRVINGQMLYIGGHDDTNFSSSIYATTDGVTWALVGTLPFVDEFQAMTRVGDTEWMMGGWGSTSHQEVLTSTDGITWTTAGSLPAARGYGGAQYFQGKVWLIGGDDGGQPWAATSPSSWSIQGANLTLPRLYSALVQFTPP